MDPVTLETLGRYDFEGQIKSPTFTAHPKFDPETGEMICFAYEAGGNGNDGSLDIIMWTIDADGKKTEEAFYKAPFAGMIHDIGVSKNYVVMPLTPIKVNMDRMRRGGEKFAWDPYEDQWYGLVPRRGGKSEDIIWFRADNGKLSAISLLPLAPKANKTSFPGSHSRLLRERRRPRRGGSHRRRRQRL